MMLMYFWLNYCDENHIEKIPTAVENIFVTTFFI